MTADPLSAALSRLPPPGSRWDGRHRIGPRPADAQTLADLAQGGPALAALVTDKRQQAKGGDDRLGCAYLLGDIAWEVGNLLAGLWLAGWQIGTADPAAAALTTRAEAWEDAGETGTAYVIDLTLDPAHIAPGPADPIGLARAMEALHHALILALVRSTGLAAAAQWRLVGDGLSGALLHQGKAQNQVDRAIAIGRAILADRSTRLHSRQAEFVEITLPDRDLRDWFRLRGGCCRYYTSDAGDYCSTCVLRDRADQIARLQDHLQGTYPT